MAKKSFYEASTYTGNLRPGYEIAVQRTISYQGENADFKPFLTVPHKELEQRLKDSMAAEKKIHDELKEAIKAWDEHGAQTLLLEKAIEYLKTEPVKHTANEWKQQEDGTWEISNMVYRMTFKIVPIGDEWKLSWELQYTAPGQNQERYYSYYERGPKKRIEYEGSKKYKTMAGAQKYIQGKFDQYARCFETLSPPVPKSVKSLFCVNGQVLQGYTISPLEKEAAVNVSPEQLKPDDKTVDALLSCLGDGDLTPAPAPETAQARTESAKPPVKSSAPHRHKKSGRAR